MSHIDEITVGDSYGAVFSWTKPTDANPDVSEDVEPASATAEVIHVRTRTSIDLGASVVTVSGNDTTFVVPTSATALAGLYRLYVSATFADGSVVTRSRLFLVEPKDGRS